jgi:hypothetical protein
MEFSPKSVSNIKRLSSPFADERPMVINSEAIEIEEHSFHPTPSLRKGVILFLL